MPSVEEQSIVAVADCNWSDTAAVMGEEGIVAAALAEESGCMASAHFVLGAAAGRAEPVVEAAEQRSAVV